MTVLHAPRAAPAGGLVLAFNLAFADLYCRDGLVRVDAAFLDHLSETFAPLHQRLIAARKAPEAFAMKDRAELIIAVGPHLESFLGKLFGIEREVGALQARHNDLSTVYEVKRQFVQRKALVGMKSDQAEAIDGRSVGAELERRMGGPLSDQRFAKAVAEWQAAEADHAEDLSLAAGYAAWAALTPAGREATADNTLFRSPKKLDMHHLVPVVELTVHGTAQLALGDRHHLRHREGFALTDPGTDLIGALDQAGYCIKCHHQHKDSCSHGMREKAGLGEKVGAFKKSAFGVPLNGCPLEEKISEMNELKGLGYTLGALAVVTIDNPMCAATGHRICNDCMKSCIYQKQEPVDIPQIETRTLKDVLELPWGFEIYSLLTRWNPLDIDRPLPKAPTGKKVLVVGLGPAGFTLSHHLMNDGHAVVAVDGLKIEPLPTALSGVDPLGRRQAFTPVRDVEAELFEPLDDRVMAGFGGVAEYGITVRWNKNFLKVIRLLLERRNEFAMYGGVRFGGTLTIDQAFELGFDHVAMCAGAGRPTVIPMRNGLARGVRQASDFLMALQLTGAAKAESIANLQVRMPVVVIGGGLTAIDTATESMAYYIVQVEKFLARYEALVAAYGPARVRNSWTIEETEIGDGFIAHAQAVRAERRAAGQARREPRFIDLLNDWGGVTVAYRRRMIDAPSYTLNHEEVTKAMEEGIRFAECLAPKEVELDRYGATVALKLAVQKVDVVTGEISPSEEVVSLPARSILVAAGTQPNTVLAREDEHNVRLDGRYFQAIDESGQPVKPDRIAKPSVPHVLMSLKPDHRAVSFFGDLHPSYAGNVVKAMGSAKQGYPVVSRQLERVPSSGPTPRELVDRLNDELRAVVHEVIRLTPNIIEVVVRAPMAARAFKPGQFYRLQNFEVLAPRVDCGAGLPACTSENSNGANAQAGNPAPQNQLGTVLAMEGLALTGASVDAAKGLLSVIVLEMGGSSDLCALLKPGEPVILMGPTGAPTETPSQETVILAGGGLGNAVLFSIGQKLRSAGSKVVYFAGYKKMIDRYKVDEIEKAADVVTWCSDEGPGFTPTRVQDRAFVGNIVQAMVAYARGELGEVPIPLNEADRFIVIGSDGMMRGVQQARHGVLKPYLKPDHEAIGSINSPMQCMMKEICAQCLQVHHDPITGKEDIVFSCANQDQPLDRVRFENLRERLTQNGTQEKLTKAWIDHSLRMLKVRA